MFVPQPLGQRTSITVLSHGKRGEAVEGPQGTSCDRGCCRTCSSMAYPGFPRRWQEVLQPDDGVVKSCPAPVGGPDMATREGEAGGTPPVRAMGPLRAAARRVEDVLEEAQHLSMQMVAQQVRAANHPPPAACPWC